MCLQCTTTDRRKSDNIIARGDSVTEAGDGRGRAGHLTSLHYDETWMRPFKFPGSQLAPLNLRAKGSGDPSR